MAIDKSDYKRVFATVFPHTEELLLNIKRHPNALNQYLDSWLEIAEKAAEVDNLALQDVILLFIDATEHTFKKTPDLDNLTDVHWQLLKKWDTLFANYINAPDDQQIALALIQCLNDPLFAMRLDSEDELMLLDSFLPVINQLLSHSNDVVVEESTINKVALQPMSVWEKVTVLFAETDLAFQDLLTQNKQISKESYAKNVKYYLESWKAIAEFINTEQNEILLATLPDIVSLLIEFTCQLFNQTDGLNNEQQGLLEQWHNLFARYIKIKGSQQLAGALVRLLSHPAWLQPISKADEKMLLDSFSAAVNESSNTKETQYPSPAIAIAEASIAAPTILETPKKTIALWQQLELLFNKTTLSLTAAIESQLQNNNIALKSNLQLYLENWLELAQQIEIDAEQLGLLDVVLLFIEISRQTFYQLDNLDKKQITLLNKWQSLFSSYLKAKGNWQLAISLVKCLRDPLWQGAIMAEDEEMLLAGFTESQPKIVLESSNESANETFTTTELESTQTEENLEVIAETLPHDIEEQPFNIDTNKEFIWQDIKPVFNQAVAALKSTVDSNIINDVTAFKQGLQDYLERWQIITDIIATDNHLNGLFDVVLLFTEISKQTFIPLDTLNSEQFALLNHWHGLFSQFFTSQNQYQCATGLIKCLRNTSWFEPIEAEDEAMLLDGFDREERPHTELSVENEPDLILSVAANVEKNPIWQKIAVFFDDVQLQLPIMQGLLAENNLQMCRDYLQQYAEHWLVIAGIIAEEHEISQFLADVSCLFADNCTDLVEQNISPNQSYISLLESWHTAFIAYLQDDSSTEQARFLIECLKNSHWLHPLTMADEEMLLEILTDENLHQSIIAEDSENLLMFNQGLFAEDETHHFTSFVDEEDEEPLILIETEAVVPEQELEEVALFADEISDLHTADDFALFVEELESEESAIEQKQEEVALFADEISDLHTADDFALFAEKSEYKDSTSILVNEESILPSASVNPELIGMVRDEFALLVNEFNTEINAALDTEAFRVTLKNHEFKFENLAKACNTIGLLGLEQVFGQLSLNMRSRRGSDTFSETESDLFKTALPLIQNYIAAITERDNAIALVAHLSMPGWKQPLSEMQIEPLITLLSALVVSSHNRQLDNRKTVAESADVSLELPEDVNSELLDSLLNELPILTNNFSAVIQKIISSDRAVPQLLEAQRIAHTLKGSGNIVGVAGIAVLTHHLEEILEYLTKQEAFPTKALASVLLESADCLEMMSDLMFNGEKQPPEQALPVLQNVLNWANQIANHGLPAEDSDVETTTLPVQPDTDITPPVLKETKSLELAAMTRVPSETIDKLLRMTGEGNILNEQVKERIKRFSNELKFLNDLTWQMQSLVSELDQSISIQSYNTKVSRASIDNEFDALEMEQYNELHTAASRIAEVATDIREVNIHMDQQLVDLKYLMVEEDSIQKENQEMVQSIRMVPANTIASRCQRIVRQACRATNKEVDLEIKGANILIDSEILNDMVDPLMHLLRNSIDHGIEPLHIREKYNKPKVGKITLEFSRKGNYAVISCKDDGGGLASGNILQTAIKKGLITAKQQLTEAEIHKLILIPGFSTRAVATQTSGRGIGMDAIQTKISSIQGQMSLFSARGEGLTIEITIPLTLSSMLSLLVKCGGQTMAISNRGLRKIHHSDECTLVQETDQLYCDIDYKRYPAKYFSELVGIPITYSAEQKLQALRLEDEIGRTHIVFVEELLGYKDLLVKNMGGYIPHIQGITGASILGNGDVAPVIDLVEMLHHAAKYDYLLADATKALADSINGLPVALVIDDSLSARRAVAMLLKDSGLEVETAIDGLDAIKQIDKTMPDIILVDLEMPRMNGIELTAHVRGREDMKNTPIIMITSRATEKHRKQAEAAGVTKFMTKPFTEDDLIHNVRMLMK